MGGNEASFEIRHVSEHYDENGHEERSKSEYSSVLNIPAPIEVRLLQSLSGSNVRDADIYELLDEIKHLEVLINIHNTNGYTALHVACCNNNSI